MASQPLLVRSSSGRHALHPETREMAPIDQVLQRRRRLLVLATYGRGLLAEAELLNRARDAALRAERERRAQRQRVHTRHIERAGRAHRHDGGAQTRTPPAPAPAGPAAPAHYYPPPLMVRSAHGVRDLGAFRVAPAQRVRAPLMVRSVSGTRVLDPGSREIVLNTAVHDAARAGDAHGIRRLRELGASVGVPDHDGCTPVWIAAHEGQGGVVLALHELGADLSVPNAGGETPLLAAARNGHVAAVEALLARGADVDQAPVRSFREAVAGGDTPLFVAAVAGHQAVVDVLLAAGADVDLADAGRGYGRALHRAARCDDVAVVTALLAAGADVDPRDEWGDTPLLLAAENGHEAVAGVLLAAGADVEAECFHVARRRCDDDTSDTPLLVAARDGHDAVVAVLLAAGASADGLASAPSRNIDANRLQRFHLSAYEGVTPLLFAAHHGHAAVAERLLEAGADVNKPASQGGALGAPGVTPLYTAVQYGCTAVVEVLLAWGADVDLVCELGTALSAARQLGDEARHHVARYRPGLQCRCEEEQDDQCVCRFRQWVQIADAIVAMLLDAPAGRAVPAAEESAGPVAAATGVTVAPSAAAAVAAAAPAGDALSLARGNGSSSSSSDDGEGGG